MVHIVILTTENLYGYGNNRKGQLGLGHQQPSFSKISFDKVPLQEIRDVRYNEVSTVLVTENKIFHCGLKKLCDHTATDRHYVNELTEVEFGHPITNIDLGTSTLVINSEGTLWGSGSPYEGELGLGTTSLSFTRLPFRHFVTKVTCGDHHTMVLSEAGLFGCGLNVSGQLGMGNLDEFPDFTPLPSYNNFDANKITDVFCGGYCTFVVCQEELFSFGCNEYGQLGLNIDNEIIFVPTKIQIRGTILDIACGNNHTIILTDNGLFGTGLTSGGQLGFIPDEALIIYGFEPIPFEKPVSGIWAGGNWTVINSQGKIYICGNKPADYLTIANPTSNPMLLPLEGDAITFGSDTKRFKNTKRAHY